MTTIFRSIAFGESTLLSEFLESEIKSPPLIIIEGNREISDQRTKLAKILKNTTSIRQRLADIADVCDYNASYSDGDYFFTKKYSDHNELPCTTELEIINYTKYLSNLIPSVFQNSKIKSNTDHIHAFFQSLSDSEWDIIKKDVLPVSTLSITKKNNLVPLFRETFCGSIRNACEKFENNFADVDSLILSAQRDEDNNSYLVTKKQKKDIFYIFQESNKSASSKLSTQKDLNLNISFYSNTIQSIIEKINKYKNSLFSVSQSISQKPISIVGYKSDYANRTIRGIAKIYNLQLNIKNNNVFISQKIIPIYKSENTWQNAIENLPVPLQRILYTNSFETPSKHNLWHLLPVISNSKDKEISFKNLNTFYKTCLTLNQFSKIATELRDNDMKRLDLYTNNINSLYLSFRRSIGQHPTFSIMTSKQGKLVTGVEYQIRRDVERN
jgi:hypothetical protein